MYVSTLEDYIILFTATFNPHSRQIKQDNEAIHRAKTTKDWFLEKISISWCGLGGELISIPLKMCGGTSCGHLVRRNYANRHSRITLETSETPFRKSGIKLPRITFLNMLESTLHAEAYKAGSNKGTEKDGLLKSLFLPANYLNS